MICQKCKKKKKSDGEGNNRKGLVTTRLPADQEEWIRRDVPVRLRDYGDMLMWNRT